MVSVKPTIAGHPGCVRQSWHRHEKTDTLVAGRENGQGLALANAGYPNESSRDAGGADVASSQLAKAPAEGLASAWMP